MPVAITYSPIGRRHPGKLSPLTAKGSSKSTNGLVRYSCSTSRGRPGSGGGMPAVASPSRPGVSRPSMKRPSLTALTAMPPASATVMAPATTTKAERACRRSRSQITIAVSAHRALSLLNTASPHRIPATIGGQLRPRPRSTSAKPPNCRSTGSASCRRPSVVSRPGSVSSGAASNAPTRAHDTPRLRRMIATTVDSPSVAAMSKRRPESRYSPLIHDRPVWPRIGSGM